MNKIVYEVSDHQKAFFAVKKSLLDWLSKDCSSIGESVVGKSAQGSQQLFDRWQPVLDTKLQQKINGIYNPMTNVLSCPYGYEYFRDHSCWNWTVVQKELWGLKITLVTYYWLLDEQPSPCKLKSKDQLRTLSLWHPSLEMLISTSSARE